MLTAGLVWPDGWLLLLLLLLQCQVGVAVTGTSRMGPMARWANYSDAWHQQVRRHRLPLAATGGQRPLRPMAADVFSGLSGHTAGTGQASGAGACCCTGCGGG